MAIVAAVVAGVFATSLTRAEAQTPPVSVPVEICSTVGEIPELGGRVCAGFEAGSVVLAAVCQQLSLPADVCGLVDATPVDESVMAAYESSWVHRALRLQEHLDRDEPLINSLVPHTHNSANSTAYGPSVSTFDPNQRYTIGDQLRMDIRGIELDLHWAPSLAGSLDTGGNAVVLCHGTSVPVGDLVIHVGCSIDMVLSEGLVEIRDFLAAPENADQVVLLYLENQLDGDPTGHAEAVAALEEILGDMVFRPPPGVEGDCTDIAMNRSRQDVLDAGAQIVLVGNCGPGEWSDWVFERGPAWNESGYGGSYPAYPDCVDERRRPEDYDNAFIRHWEDLTFVSAIADGSIDHLEPDTVRNMVHCGVDMIGFDRLTPFDGRLEALVWSWAPNEPSTDLDESCAYRADGGRFFTDAECTTTRSFACRDVAGDWLVADPGPWTSGDAACAALDARFAVPPTGWENQRLGEVVAAAGGDPVWLNLGRASAAEQKPDPITPATPDAPTPDPDPAPTGSGPQLPVTGHPIPLLAAVVILAAAVAIRARLDSARMFATPLQKSSQDRGRHERCMR